MLTVESGCELETNVEDGAILVLEVLIFEVIWEGLMDVASVRGPVTVTEDVIGGVTAVSVMSDSVDMPIDEEGRDVFIVAG